MKDADDESVSVSGSQQKQRAEVIVRASCKVFTPVERERT